jgi:hypothetical protein
VRRRQRIAIATHVDVMDVCKRVCKRVCVCVCVCVCVRVCVFVLRAQDDIDNDQDATVGTQDFATSAHVVHGAQCNRVTARMSMHLQ